MMRICVATGTRAEYGLLKPLINKINGSVKHELQLLVTGTHLSPEFGLTYKQIELDGITINSKVEMLLSSDTSEGIVKSMGLGLIGYADALKDLKPELIVLLGDRFEMLALATAALIFNIPIAHLHGGELTEGAYDDSIRHAITKMSHLHFTSTEDYRQRVIQLGEQPNTVFNVGAIGIDNLTELKLLTQDDLSTQLNIHFKEFNYLVTFHPETLGSQTSEVQFKVLLNAIAGQNNSFFIFTYANADTDGRVINKMIDEYVESNKASAIAFHSMGQLRYLSAMKYVTAVVGNSSSGIIEAPSFRVPSINIGERQKGRLQAKSVINVNVVQHEIEDAFFRVKDATYRSHLSEIENPYGIGGTSLKIMEILETLGPRSIKNKTFYNIT